MKEAVPIHYQIHLEPDLETFQFRGKVRILMHAHSPIREIRLNALDLAIWSCKLRLDETFKALPFSLDPAREELKILLQKEMDGELDLQIDFVGCINDRMIGFYRSKYKRKDEERTLAATQFEESDARRAFPCFDHPAFKATFDIEMVIKGGHIAVSNCPVSAETPLDGNRKLVQFKTTPRMSTYLVFFAVGDFEILEDKWKDISIRVIAPHGSSKYGGFGMEFAKKSLEFSEEYFGVKYPLPKLDLIALPDFAAGAMENWGAITFRENLLLHYPHVTSKEGEQRICEVIAHEIVHQWFGDLVTPSDWRYLWLNESFATYLAYGIVDHFCPDWTPWDMFLLGQTQSALVRDALRDSIPIEIPGGEHVVINTSTAPIIYNKGGSVLRQVEAYTGGKDFDEGVRGFLRKHRYSCAASHDLWEALDENSRKPVAEMMKNWVEQPGYPIVEAQRDGERLRLSQKRFTYLPNRSRRSWIIPLSVKVFFERGRTETIEEVFEGKEKVIEIGREPRAYKINAGQKGFYRVRYLDDNLTELGSMAASKVLAPEDRWGVQNDLYALVKSCEVDLDVYLDFVAHYAGEDAFLPSMGVANNLLDATLIVEGPKRGRVASMARELLEGYLAGLGTEPGPGEPHSRALLRETLMWYAVIFGSGQTMSFAQDRFETLMGGGRVHPDISRTIMRVGAWNGDRKVFQWLEGRLRSSESEHERHNIITAMGCFRDPELIRTVEEYILKAIPGRNKFVPIAQLAANPFAISGLWEWYAGNLKEFEQFHPVHYERVVSSIVPVGGLGKETEVKEFFRHYEHRELTVKDVIRMSLERLDINSRLRTRNAPKSRQ
ncbi:MAG: M1 family metallopeptidase [Deltaproteobacteria bacterium]|nr:M1 family metallopeptidase [Deltaproteobacteria bacterium]MBW2136003.1 M1 family metallopeptidase [Deltaproteobacteria bacterium]